MVKESVFFSGRRAAPRQGRDRSEEFVILAAETVILKEAKEQVFDVGRRSAPIYKGDVAKIIFVAGPDTPTQA